MLGIGDKIQFLSSKNPQIRQRKPYIQKSVTAGWLGEEPCVRHLSCDTLKHCCHSSHHWVTSSAHSLTSYLQVQPDRAWSRALGSLFLPWPSVRSDGEDSEGTHSGYTRATWKGSWLVPVRPPFIPPGIQPWDSFLRASDGGHLGNPSLYWLSPLPHFTPLNPPAHVPPSTTFQIN